MRELLTILACTGILSYGNSQTVSNLDTAGLRSGSAIYNKFIAGDSLCSSFCIVIKTSVRPHRHEFHSEQVLVLEGSPHEDGR